MFVRTEWATSRFARLLAWSDISVKTRANSSPPDRYERISGSSGLFRERLTAFLMLAVVCLALYSSSFDVPYFGDDYQLVFEHPREHLVRDFFQVNRFNTFYRPIQASILALIQTEFGSQTWPIRCLHLLLHTLLAWMVYLFIRRIGFPQIYAWVGSLYLLSAQVAASAILNNDTVSQILGGVFGAASLWLLYESEVARDASETARRSLRFYLLSVGAFVLALLSKETSLSFLPMGILVMMVVRWQRGKLTVSARDLLLRSLPFVVAAVGYLFVRSAIGSSQPQIAEGPYGVHIGLNIVENVVQMIFASMLPLSSVSAFVAFREHNLPLIVTAAASALLVLAAAVVGLLRAGRLGLLAAFFLLAVIATVPVLLLNKVSEHFVYNLLPYTAVLVGVGVGSLLERSLQKTVPGTIAVALSTIVLWSNAIAVRQKAAQMTDNGRRAEALLEQLPAYAEGAPSGRKIYMVNPPSDGPTYSTFRVPGFNVFNYGLLIFERVTGRKDVSFIVTSPDTLDRVRDVPNSVIITYDPRTLRLLRLDRDTSGHNQ